MRSVPATPCRAPRPRRTAPSLVPRSPSRRGPPTTVIAIDAIDAALVDEVLEGLRPRRSSSWKLAWPGCRRRGHPTCARAATGHRDPSSRPSGADPDQHTASSTGHPGGARAASARPGASSRTTCGETGDVFDAGSCEDLLGFRRRPSTPTATPSSSSRLATAAAVGAGRDLRPDGLPERRDALAGRGRSHVARGRPAGSSPPLPVRRRHRPALRGPVAGPTPSARSRPSATRRCSCPTTSTRGSGRSPRWPPPRWSRPRSTSGRSCSTATSATRWSSPASWPPSTCCRRAGSRSASAPAGRRSTTTARASRWIRPGVRVDRMIEHTAVLKGLFADGPVHLRGRALHDHRPRRARPKPHRPGGPPILIGGGAPRLLRFAGGDRRHRRRQRVDPLRRDRHRRPPRTAWPSASTRRWRGCARAPATASTTSSSTPGWRSPRSPTTPPASPRPMAAALRRRRRADFARVPAHPGRLADRDRRAPRAAPRPLGLLVPRHPRRQGPRLRADRRRPHRPVAGRRHP